MGQRKNQCTKCGFENDPIRNTCKQCGHPLAATTIATSSAAAVEMLKPLAQPYALNVNEVMFLVAGNSKPMTVTRQPGQTDIIIGRGVPGETSPDLDLTEISEAAASVSRRHALVNFTGDHPSIKDLNSTNSTWVNENLLKPNQPRELRNGDLIRLGRQFVFVYFASEASPENIVVLDETEHPATELTPYLLSHHIIGFLQTLSDINNIVNEAAQNDATKLVIKNLDVLHAPKKTKVLIAGGQETIRLAMEFIGSWRKTYGLSGQQSSGSDAAGLEDEMQNLVYAILDAGVDDLTTEMRDAYTKQLQPHVQTIALHSLELSLEWEW